MHRLINAEERNQAHPDTFHIPPSEERNSLQAGDYVKLILEPGERCWFLVIESHEDSYIGQLRNAPIDHIGLHFGESIVFKAHHVCEICRGGFFNMPERQIAIGWISLSDKVDATITLTPEREVRLQIHEDDTSINAIMSRDIAEILMKIINSAVFRSRH